LRLLRWRCPIFHGHALSRARDVPINLERCAPERLVTAVPSELAVEAERARRRFERIVP
jgi:hypothetical protein